MTDDERVKEIEKKIKLKAEFDSGTKSEPKQNINITNANWHEKREKIHVILKTKGMDSQQVEQAMASIDQIMWGT